MNTIDLDSFLGVFSSTLTESQRDEITSAAESIEKVYAGEDYREEREAMLSGIVQTVLGDDDLSSIIQDWHTANQAQARALARMRGAITVEVSRTNELAVSKSHGISRPTIRKAFGK